jgi:hypothetical protein
MASDQGSFPLLHFFHLELTDGILTKNYLIDDGLIANNPSLYAFILAKYLSKARKLADRIRLLSFSTGSFQLPKNKQF